MKKILALLCIITLFACTACTNTTESELDDDYNLDENDYDDDYGYDTDISDDTNDNDYYTSSISSINETLNTSLGYYEETDDMDYTERGELYSSRATAYQTALDELDALDYDSTYSDYHQAIRSYYEENYNLYNDFSTSYAAFESEDDETSFWDELGDDTREVGRDIQDAYYDALQGIGIDTNY